MLLSDAPITSAVVPEKKFERIMTLCMGDYQVFLANFVCMQDGKLTVDHELQRINRDLYKVSTVMSLFGEFQEISEEDSKDQTNDAQDKDVRPSILDTDGGAILNQEDDEDEEEDQPSEEVAEVNAVDPALQTVQTQNRGLMDRTVAGGFGLGNKLNVDSQDTDFVKLNQDNV